ncbi:4-hydroxyphenylpyruvate dioxygenase [Thauera humireducens]|uniref:4-hydroxyphenylpyruvate dioxygenase n=1 Tax=Thauera humireducens TaxID=1134435 RepID=A0A127K977_9RHOO|nr:VOC family protein [Thauera humireducens]AMO38472.1 4-hydroxyphenylpyruvate dioxygenase [Thauera humireducens]CAH1746025.1 4-hydroxyphenylpyruvate dioxygenase [Thauera humireducens]
MTARDLVPEPLNPLGIDGVEFIEFVTGRPQALGGVLQRLGFAPIARHRSREVVLYRQGAMNLIVNAEPGGADPSATFVSAVAFRVRDAAYAMRHSLDAGAWEVPRRAAAMELNIPGILGSGESAIYFVDRYKDFSIYDVDFVPLPGTDSNPPALAGLHYFGLVQAVGAFRSSEWVDFYRQMLGFRQLTEADFVGILPKGTLLQSPCGRFYLQLIEPPEGAEDIHWDDGLVRIGLGAPDVLEAMRVLRERGVVFIDEGALHPGEKGALTQVYLGSVTFELVASRLAAG